MQLPLLVRIVGVLVALGAFGDHAGPLTVTADEGPPSDDAGMRARVMMMFNLFIPAVSKRC